MTDEVERLFDVEAIFGLVDVALPVGLPDGALLRRDMVAFPVGHLIADQHDKIAFDAEVTLAAGQAVAAEASGAVFLIKIEQFADA